MRQRKVEARNFDIRKQLLEYDDVAMTRRVIYQQRNELLASQDISDTIRAMRADVLAGVVAQFVPPESMEEQWDLPGLEKALAADFRLQVSIEQWLKDEPDLHAETLRGRVVEQANAAYEKKFESVDKDVLHHYERAIMLQSVDNHWREHLAALDHLRQGIHLRGYAQKNPKQEYKREAFELFGAMLERIKRDVTTVLTSVQVRTEAEMQEVAEEIETQEAVPKNAQYQHPDYSGATAEENGDVAVAERPAPVVQPFVRSGDKVGRNDPCPCGSGKKYKQCHGKLT
jgi:preprotein translocase subunit SecA